MRIAGFLAWAAAATAATTVVAGELDYHVSVPKLGAIVRVDAATGAWTTHASGLSVPFYGYFEPDGDLVMPDRGLSAVLRIGPGGGVQPVTAGGLFTAPITALPRPGGGMLVSDLLANRIIAVAEDGMQSMYLSGPGSGGLLSGPGGMALAPDGTLYVSNHLASSILRVTPAGATTVFSADSLLHAPAGLALDGAGNLFVALYYTQRIVRLRLDGGGAAEPFAGPDPLLHGPNDLKLARDGRLLVSTQGSRLLAIDAVGGIEVLFHDPALGELDGVARPVDAVPCAGTFTPYGAGVAGSGGLTPRLQGVFSPCLGAEVALEMRDVVGGAAGLLVLGVGEATLPFFGGALLVDLAQWHVLLPLVLPGAPGAPGAGDLVVRFTVPPAPELVGATFVYQVVAADAGAVKGVAMTNGLREVVGE